MIQPSGKRMKSAVRRRQQPRTAEHGSLLQSLDLQRTLAGPRAAVREMVGHASRLYRHYGRYAELCGGIARTRRGYEVWVLVERGPTHATIHRLVNVLSGGE